MLPGMTHQMPLAACMAATRGPVLELGAGNFSTPLLHGLCLPTQRRLVTVESNGEWAERFDSMNNAWHRVLNVANYDDFDVTSSAWSVVFVDHAPADRRVLDLRRIRGRAELIVIHDTEEQVYDYETVLPEFRYRVDCKLWTTWTTIVSNTDDLSWFTQ